MQFFIYTYFTALYTPVHPELCNSRMFIFKIHTAGEYQDMSLIWKLCVKVTPNHTSSRLDSPTESLFFRLAAEFKIGCMAYPGEIAPFESYGFKGLVSCSIATA